jgi:predicted tellurium resistance membrane protein TerC
MLMPFLVATALAIGLVQLSALSVWATVLAITLKVVLALALAIALYVGTRMLWRKYLRCNQQGE